jgi:hypothetical protein
LYVIARKAFLTKPKHTAEMLLGISKDVYAPAMKRPRRLPVPFDIIHRRIYSNNRCFYCGKLFRSERSREHVFPEWLQNQFGLADQMLTLLNRTMIPYRSLKVPCCRICNNVHLSQLENRVKRLLFEQTVEEARDHLDQIFIWVTKILLAIVYAERLLPFSRRHPSGNFPIELKQAAQLQREADGRGWPRRAWCRP